VAASSRASIVSRLLRPRLRSLLLVVNLVIVLLPLAGIGVLGLYESELVRQTEANLIGQGAYIAAAFRQAYEQQQGAGGPRPRQPESLNPIPATIDVASARVLPPAEDARPSDVPVDPAAEAAGRAVDVLIRHATRTTLAGVRVVDASGGVVASSRGELGMSLSHREEVRRALVGENVSLLRERSSSTPSPPLRSISRGTLIRVFVAMPIRLDERVVGAVVLSRTPVDIVKGLYLNRWKLIPALFQLLVAVVIVSLLTTLAIQRPVRDLVRQAEAISAGEDEDAGVIPWPGTLEVAQLSQAIATMARGLQERADYIRSFARSVSHEFKTPLTSLRGSIELLDDHFGEMSAKERSRFLENVAVDVERLDLLVSRLLDLAQADVLVPGRERCDVLDLIGRVKARYPKVSVSFDESNAASMPPAAIAPDVLETVILNLCDNAFQHGGEDVGVALAGRLRRVPEGQVYELEVSDDGAGISPANAERIFDAFFTTARDTGGTGLGLSIVRSLLRAHGGSIELSPGAPGSRFRVTIPTA
jgi:signal transduction histidine kinase